MEALAANRADQSLDEWMRERHVRDTLDLCHLEYSKIGLPLVESIQRIMIRAEIFRQTCSSDRLLEHSADRQAIDDSALDAESDELHPY